MLTYAMHLISIARIPLIIVGISLIVLIPEDT